LVLLRQDHRDQARKRAVLPSRATWWAVARLCRLRLTEDGHQIVGLDQLVRLGRQCGIDVEGRGGSSGSLGARRDAADRRLYDTGGHVHQLYC
jgi:hypothetical protein